MSLDYKPGFKGPFQHISRSSVKPIAGSAPSSGSYKDQLELDYQPNFILVNPPDSHSQASIFGDILPFYSSYQELSSLIVTSWEALNDLVLKSRIVFTCIISFFNQLVNNLAYQTYLTTLAGYEIVSQLPDTYFEIKNHFVELIQTLANAQTRELWWIEIKIDIRRIIDKTIDLLQTTWLVLRKFYLAGLVFICLGLLNFSFAFTSSSASSFLSNLVQNYSFINPQQNRQVLAATTTVNPTNYITTDQTPVQKIIEYRVTEGDTLQKVAEMYGIGPETIRVNNGLENQDLKLDQKIYIPFDDGYILSLDEDATPESLADVAKVDKEIIISENKAIYDAQNNKFAKGSLVLIPGENPQELASLFRRDQEIKDIAKMLQSQTKRNENLSKRAVSSDTYRGRFSAAARSNGFIWPTTGTVSRCVQPGHVACDIANFSAPPIFAVQDGVVTTISYYDMAGYGLAVIIDHGNGLKTLYAHMSEIYVTKGQILKQGQAIGRMGQTGWATGIHLHFEVIQNGVKQNPLAYLP
jgi:murein DD-endopeptidase MepM/ murein hydrolase activator NlpD